MNTFTLTVGNGIASLFDADDMPNSMPIAEGKGETNDEAVADLILSVTFNTED